MEKGSEGEEQPGICEEALGFAIDLEKGEAKWKFPALREHLWEEGELMANSAELRAMLYVAEDLWDALVEAEQRERAALAGARRAS